MLVPRVTMHLEVPKVLGTTGRLRRRHGNLLPPASAQRGLRDPRFYPEEPGAHRRSMAVLISQWVLGNLLASLHRARYDLRLMTGVTQLLHALEQGDPHVASRLLPLISGQRRRSWRISWSC